MSSFSKSVSQDYHKVKHCANETKQVEPVPEVRTVVDLSDLYFNNFDHEAKHSDEEDWHQQIDISDKSSVDE